MIGVSMKRHIHLFLILLFAPSWFSAFAAESAIVSHISVTSDKTEDVSSLEAWKKSFIKDGMTDEQKAMAIWKSVIKFRHQEIPPQEFLEAGMHPHDPIKDFNVYGYGQCCCASANIESLARYVGLEARGWGIIGHSVPEIKWGGKWHMLDASLIAYFPKSDGQPASVTEMSQNIKQWYQANPQYKGNSDALAKFMRNGNWKTGPEMLRNCPTYDNNGWLPAATHGWYSTMQEYADPAKLFLYEYGTALGYEVNVQLRKGEKLTRNWSNHGEHINLPDDLPVIRAVVGKDQLRYSPSLGDLAPGRVGNGLLEYDVPVKSADLAQAALAYENLSASDAGLSATDPSKPAVLILNMPTSYVYLSGEMRLKSVLGPRGSIVVATSDNNGLDWKDIDKIDHGGSVSVDIKSAVHRRYNYRLRLTLSGSGTRIESLKILHDVQHSQRALPALDKGKNVITFAAGPQEGTLTIQGNTNPEARTKNLLYTDFHPAVEGMQKDMLFLTGGKGSITFAVNTPGEMKRIRLGAHYRARDTRDGFEIAASFDQGKSWKSIGKLEGPFAGNSKYFVFSEVPAGARAALVRLSGVQINTTGIHDLRIDADYAQPHGGFAPIKVTYVWSEAGIEKRNVHVARTASETYMIECADKPLLKSLIIERAE
jgi:hypothetical protein